MGHRLFVCIWPTEGVRRRLETLRLSPSDTWRPVPPDNWHVTLRFIGDADPDEVDRRLSAHRHRRTTVQHGPATTMLGERQVVIPVAGADELAAAVTASTHGLGAPAERDFVGHLTVARARGPAVVADAPLDVPLRADQVVDEIALVSSHLTQAGAVYETIGRYPTT